MKSKTFSTIYAIDNNFKRATFSILSLSKLKKTQIKSKIIHHLIHRL